MGREPCSLSRFSPLALVAAVLLLVSCGGPATDALRTISSTSPIPPNARYGGPTNYFPNPSFERNMSYWAPWGAAQLRRTTRIKKVGKASAEVVDPPASPFGIQASNVVGYPGKGDRFTVSFWVKAFPSTIHKTIALEVSENGGPNHAASLVTAITRRVLTGTWQRIVATGTVKQSNRTGLSVIMFMSNSLAVGDGFYAGGATLYLR